MLMRAVYTKILVWGKTWYAKPKWCCLSNCSTPQRIFTQKNFLGGGYLSTWRGGVPRAKHKKVPTPKQKIAHISVRNRNFKHWACGIANLVAAESHCQKSGGWGACFGWVNFGVFVSKVTNRFYLILLSIDKLYHIQVNSSYGSGHYRLRHIL